MTLNVPLFHHPSLLPLSLRAYTLFHHGLPFVVLQFFEQGVQALKLPSNTPVPLQPHFKLLKHSGRSA